MIVLYVKEWLDIKNGKVSLKKLKDLSKQGCIEAQKALGELSVSVSGSGLENINKVFQEFHGFISALQKNIIWPRG
jgi:hypothetical protein